ncbi:interferon-induced, double-stranded RNA-activated protein kinase-like [Aplochiton taeniatus]
MFWKGEDLADRICAFLETKSEGVVALQISKAVGLKSAKDVNRTLYQLEKDGRIYKTLATPPLCFLTKFEPEDVLGSGGFGCVVKAKFKMDGKNYAIKIVKNSRSAEREVKALANLEHMNIVRYYTVWNEIAHWIDDTGCSSTTELESLFIQMELCEGGTLENWIAEKNCGKHMDNGDHRKIFHQILNGVECIHSNGLIHRDLKPTNILFGQKNTVKIGDFGLATAITSQTGASLDHTANTGTPLYMSPEQMENKYDEKTDIYSLGLILFLLLWKMETAMERCKVINPFLPIFYIHKLKNVSC